MSCRCAAAAAGQGRAVRPTAAVSYSRMALEYCFSTHGRHVSTVLQRRFLSAAVVH
jgi:hypothetical protein